MSQLAENPHRLKRSHQRRWKRTTGHRFYILNNPLSGTDPTGYAACIGGSDEWKTGGCAMSIKTGKGLPVVDGERGMGAETGAANSRTAGLNSQGREADAARRFANGATRSGNVKVGEPKQVTDIGSASERSNSASDSAASKIKASTPLAAVNPWPLAGAAAGGLLADDVTGVGVADDILIAIVLAGAAVYDITQRTYVTYTLRRPSGEVYVGRTSGFGTPQQIVNLRYLGHHMRAFGYSTPQVDQAVQGPQGYFAIRGREQQLIDYYGGVGSPGVGNLIRGVSRYNPTGTTYHSAANLYFGQLHEYTGIYPYLLPY